MIQISHLFSNLQCRQCFNAIFTCRLENWIFQICTKFKQKIKKIIFTNGNDNNVSKCWRALSKSSRDNSLNSCDAARCSDGKRFGLHVMSSRKVMAWKRRATSCSKSWKCFDTQCLWRMKNKIFFFNFKFWGGGLCIVP